ncbi:3'(2'),5'-bisphosphate nucleotidase CysQ [Rhizobium sp. TRM95796]|uniref:3'(2'),5'-bisphosphate nucleotidase CysQ n=1 Tax=Rhizobium sp. TRM95796 TaxID=2979862 RepID=UPI0021E92265|nr:3'(2'),5'-bisphosphate nucleotidase CysQ [Rhizobium sp. TRM95796]MCV3766811.1 3'(2'),5'-bisphosphate nucleotidase CysQ [Rhizobium sp. TRM95796]
MTFSHADDLELLREAAIAAGRVALGFFRNDVEVFWKNDGASPVTAADHAANDVLKARLLAARPDYGWLSEESEDDVSRLGASRVFVIDPIDGTRAFMTGRETWAVSAAVVEAGRPVAGVLFAPALNELYLADAGGRVEKNGAALRVGGSDPAGRFTISAADDAMAHLDADVRSRLDKVGRIPSLAYRLAMIADGRLDATLVKPHAHDWDLAAAELILVNAGGVLSDAEGAAIVYNKPDPSHDLLVAARVDLHRQVVASLSS